MQGKVANGVAAALPPPASSGPTGKVATLSLLHLRFVCGVAADVEPPPIWEAVAWGQGNMDGLATLNQALMRGLPSCRRIFGGRTNFRGSLPLIVFVKNVIFNEPLPRPCLHRGRVHALTDLPRIS